MPQPENILDQAVPTPFWQGCDHGHLRSSGFMAEAWEQVSEAKEHLEAALQERNDELLLQWLRKIGDMAVTAGDLERTKIGITMNAVKKNSSNTEIVTAAKDLIKRWKSLIMNADAAVESPASDSKKRKLELNDETKELGSPAETENASKKARYFSQDSESATEERLEGDESFGGKLRAPEWFQTCKLNMFSSIGD
jgi:hypothetical protein